jgi:hypothetical protein
VQEGFAELAQEDLKYHGTTPKNRRFEIFQRKWRIFATTSNHQTKAFGIYLGKNGNTESY